MSAGQLDRRLQLWKLLPGKDPVLGTPKPGWVLHATVWARVRDELPANNETEESHLVVSRTPRDVRIRWRSDVATTMQVSFAGEPRMEILAKAEVGRKQWLDIKVREASS
jgi:head-tail adaptor